MNNGSVFQFSSTNSPFPKGDLYVDTNSWHDVDEHRQYGSVTERYLVNYVSQSLSKSETPIILWSPQNTAEVYEGMEVVTYKAEAVRINGNDRGWKNIANTISTSDANALHNNVQVRYDKLLSKFKDNLYEIEPIFDIMPTAQMISSLYGIQIKDAKHLAYMWHEQVNNLVTRDRRFALVPGINIFSPQMSTNGLSLNPISEFMPDLPKYLKRS